MLFQHFSSFLSSLFQQPVCRLLATSIPQRSPHSPLTAFGPDIVNNQTVMPAGRHSALTGVLEAVMAAGYSVLQLSTTSGADLMIFMLFFILLITPLMLFQHFSSFFSSLFQQPVCRLLATSITQRSPHSPLSAFGPDIVNNQTVRPAGRHSALAGPLAAAMAAGYSVLQLSTTLVPIPQFLPSSSPNNADMTTTTH